MQYYMLIKKQTFVAQEFDYKIFDRVWVYDLSEFKFKN